MEITDLHVAWENYCIQRNYDRIGDVLHVSSYLKSTPLPLRAMKLQKLNEAKAAKYLAFDRDSMLFEDDLSLLNLTAILGLRRNGSHPSNGAK